jgi:UDPglucose--hexose-1-phosphate uridylyltransferase
MPELRKDPVIGRWVIISTERGKRPSDFPAPPKRQESKLCPFCPGNESSTPPEVLAFRPDQSPANKPGWTLRVISNKYPALKVEGELNREGRGIFDKMNGVGAHEVIIETPEHTKELAGLDQKRVEDVLWAYRLRTIDLKNDPRLRYILIFKNQGLEAGASLEHSHSQLIATPIIPKRVSEELDGSKKYYDYKERCIFCDIVKQEQEENVRVVNQNESFISIEPFAARFPFETWILPKKHYSTYDDTKQQEMPALAAILKDTLGRLAKALNSPPYNYIMHTRPVGGSFTKEYHWHIEIMPKLTKVAGFEWGSGFYINPTAPEDACNYLRSIQL